MTHLAVAIAGSGLLIGWPLGSDVAWLETAQLVGSAASGQDDFGFAVSASADTLLIGAPNDGEPSPGSGTAYVFVNDGVGWAEQVRLVPGDALANDQFGESVSLLGDLALVGADHDDDQGINSGSAYVFTRVGETWVESAKLLPSDGRSGGFFGTSVSLDSDAALVGAAGAAYFWVRSGDDWVEEEVLLPSDSPEGFGAPVALLGDRAVVGAWGSVYVFARVGGVWVEDAILVPSGLSQLLSFEISTSGDSILIGAEGQDSLGSNSGAAWVFVFDNDSWSEQAQLVPRDVEPGDEFGSAVALQGDRALIGARDDISGSAYVFERVGTTWSEREKLLPSDGEVGDGFGQSVALAGETAFVGANKDIEPGGGVFGSGTVRVLDNILLFEDDFESGSTASWSVTVP